MRIEDLISTWSDELLNALWDNIDGLSGQDAYEIWCDALDKEFTLENLKSLSDQDFERLRLSANAIFELDNENTILAIQIEKAVNRTIWHWTE
jgi:hypothetical protein